MKKKVLDGQPLYMAQYTALMIILLAFFIVMQSLSTVKSSGFQKGMGEVKNAFGLSGGLGLFGYIMPSRGSSAANPIGSGTSDKYGLHENLSKGHGGLGNTDAETKKSEQGKYLQVKIPIVFEKDKAAITPAGRIVLDKIKIGLMLGDYHIAIKCFAHDHRDPVQDNALALQRAANIMRYIYEQGQIPYSRMVALGNSSIRYYPSIKADAIPEQEVFFYLFHKADK